VAGQLQSQLHLTMMAGLLPAHVREQEDRMTAVKFHRTLYGFADRLHAVLQDLRDAFGDFHFVRGIGGLRRAIRSARLPASRFLVIGLAGWLAKVRRSRPTRQADGARRIPSRVLKPKDRAAKLSIALPRASAVNRPAPSQVI
jgi:hypothetical protein